MENFGRKSRKKGIKKIGSKGPRVQGAKYGGLNSLPSALCSLLFNKAPVVVKRFFPSKVDSFMRRGFLSTVFIISILSWGILKTIIIILGGYND
jgi:hypothetical protein